MIYANEIVVAKGRYIFTECDPSLAPKEYEALAAFARRPEADRPHTEYVRLREAYHARARVAEHVFENLVPTAGRSVLAQRLAGTTTYTGTINYALLGSSTTVPANGDTQLGTETYRQTITSATYVNNIAYLSCFIAQGTATATHYEGGLVIDGTGSANTGQLFSHVLFSPAITKGALNSLTLDITLTMS